MRTPITLALLLFSTFDCEAQFKFHFSVSDATKTDALDFAVALTLEICDLSSDEDRKSQGCRAFYSVEYTINGVNQSSFSYTTENYEADLTAQDYDAFLIEVRKMPIEDSDDRANGWIHFDKRDHRIFLAPGSEPRKKWQALFDRLILKHVPIAKKEKVDYVVVGDIVKATTIDFQILMKAPAAFDGKRIRLTGFYHSAFEDSTFAASKDDALHFKQAVSLGAPSSFIDAKNFKDVNDMQVTVEGTFQHYPEGARSLWIGRIDRLTYFLPTEGPKAEQAGADQPATKPADRVPAKDKPSAPTPQGGPR